MHSIALRVYYIHLLCDYEYRMKIILDTWYAECNVGLVYKICMYIWNPKVWYGIVEFSRRRCGGKKTKRDDEVNFIFYANTIHSTVKEIEDFVRFWNFLKGFIRIFMTYIKILSIVPINILFDNVDKII